MPAVFPPLFITPSLFTLCVFAPRIIFLHLENNLKSFEICQCNDMCSSYTVDLMPLGAVSYLKPNQNVS